MEDGVVIDYDNLCYALRGGVGNVVAVNPLTVLKEFVNATNVNYVGRFGIVLFLSEHGPDDPSLLDYVASIGAKIVTSNGITSWNLPLHVATFKGKPKIVRKLLDFGITPNHKDTFGDVPLNVAMRYDNECPANVQLCAKVLVDAGAKTSMLMPDWMHEFIATRENARGGCMVILGLRQAQSLVFGHNGKDVLRMIARCLWGTRGNAN